MCLSINIFLDWVEDKQYGKIISLDGESLTLRTDSTLTDTETETIVVRFQSNSLDQVNSYSTFFFFKFSSSPYFRVVPGGATRYDVDNLPSEDDKVWTLKKTTTFLEVTCNGVVIVKFQYSTLLDSDSKEKWSFESKNYLFGRDTATDAYMINYTPGNLNRMLFNI